MWVEVGTPTNYVVLQETLMQLANKSHCNLYLPQCNYQYLSSKLGRCTLVKLSNERAFTSLSGRVFAPQTFTCSLTSTSQSHFTPQRLAQYKFTNEIIVETLYLET